MKAKINAIRKCARMSADGALNKDVSLSRFDRAIRMSRVKIDLPNRWTIAAQTSPNPIQVDGDFKMATNHFNARAKCCGVCFINVMCCQKYPPPDVMFNAKPMLKQSNGAA